MAFIQATPGTHSEGLHDTYMSAASQTLLHSICHTQLETSAPVPLVTNLPACLPVSLPARAQMGLHGPEFSLPLELARARAKAPSANTIMASLGELLHCERTPNGRNSLGGLFDGGRTCPIMGSTHTHVVANAAPPTMSSHQSRRHATGALRREEPGTCIMYGAITQLLHKARSQGAESVRRGSAAHVHFVRLSLSSLPCGRRSAQA